MQVAEFGFALYAFLDIQRGEPQGIRYVSCDMSRQRAAVIPVNMNVWNEKEVTPVILSYS